MHGFAWVAWTLGRGQEVLDLAKGEPSDTPWLRAARAVAVGDFGAAADIFAGIKTPAFEAFYRLQSGNEPDVRAALEFYRRVGATRYLRQGEAMLAASA
ncbi:MAG: hypothetical protein E6G36_14420 [Actinobacteria bacterium]|nr:MAG: hypothetical protein E6G36_14420 [Actinomycetota bacterium]